MNIAKIVCLVLGIVFFIMAGLNVPKYNWTGFGLAAVTASFLF